MLQGRRQHDVIDDCFYHKVRVNNRLYSSIKWSTIIHSSRPRLRQTSGVCSTGSTSPVINASVRLLGFKNIAPRERSAVLLLLFRRLLVRFQLILLSHAPDGKTLKYLRRTLILVR